MESKYPDIKAKLAPAIITAKINLMWYNRNKPIINEWILNHGKLENMIKPNNGCALMSNFSLMITALIAVIWHLLNYH